MKSLREELWFEIRSRRGFVSVSLVLALSCVVGACESDTGNPGPGGNGGPPLTEADFSRLRLELKEQLALWIEDERVLEAIGAIPRHEFVPAAYRHKSYEDSALPIPQGQSISQPSLVALMTELLELEGDEKVLEVGTGSGYQAAILCRLVSEVYSIEIRESLKESASQRLGDLKRRGLLTCDKIVVIEGDGSKGHPPAAPYDCIIVTAACAMVPPELTEQLKPGGRLVIPVGDRHQKLLLVHKRQDGSTLVESTINVRFVRLED
ncbi:MAG: protein-L-isoaspartate(D-aspartate) O-methyltransferase [Planctomycetota bacterium]|nr:protein-L-isoaspartate(D-aspartate) O-methyltransferase [Planctomycetota bacterium]